MRISKKNKEQLHLQLEKFSFDDLPKNPQTAVERVLVYCVTLFKPDPNFKKPSPPDPYDQTITVIRGRIKPVDQFDIESLVPRGDGAIDAFERDLNAFENNTLNDGYDWSDDYPENW